MTKYFHKELDGVLAEDLMAADTPAPDNPLTLVQKLSSELAEAQQKVSDLEQQHARAVEKLLGALAVGVRSSNPRLQVGLRNGCCSVGYCSKQLQFKPDVKSRSWNISGPDDSFTRRFNKSVGPAVVLDDDLSPLTSAIGKFFDGHFRSLGNKR